IAAAAASLGGEAIVSDALLDEVTALVEWPEPITGAFDAEFLELPREVLIASMQDHQKYFPVTRDGELLPAFITIANLASRNPAAIADGNERVIRPRLKDAAFFWEQDRRRPLDQRLADQQHIVFQKQLGSLHDKTTRVVALARVIAPATGAGEADAERAAQLSRCDLSTEMVGEFPQLQGTMGAYYAASSGESAAVSTALGEFYRPRFAGDELPASPAGQAIALADRLDTLVGIFAVGMEPTGDKDPYALRRAALGALRICIEHELDIDLQPLLAQAVEALPAGLLSAADAQALADRVMAFLLDRLRAYYADRGVTNDTVEAVLARHPTSPRDIDLRMHAVTGFRAMPEAASLAQANKRAGNLLRKAGAAQRHDIDPSRLADAAERELLDAMNGMQDTLAPRLAGQDYAGVLVELAGLKNVVDHFFDSVMVMDEDPDIRANRLALLARLHDMFLQVADISSLKPDT
ncbi:MAG: glycine--tRNA ligase subunit beta, partial [Gammaproteobacteria bacterium]|nr:glycine--tRNA ligase subunit beta [Gammaproteobacteria bacterium]